MYEELADVQSWLLERGVSSYQKYLIRDNPVGSILDARRAFAENVNRHNRWYAKQTGSTELTEYITRALYPDLPWPTVLWGVGTSVAVYIIICVPRLRLAGYLAALLFLNCFAQAFVCYHGDTAEVTRHIIIAIILFRLGIIVLGLISISIFATMLVKRLDRSREVNTISSMETGSVGSNNIVDI